MAAQSRFAAYSGLSGINARLSENFNLCEDKQALRQPGTT